jgi:dolichol-phosphate mannosyltransferase
LINSASYSNIFLIAQNTIAALILAGQIPAFLVLLSRLIRGPFRRPPLQPQAPTPDLLGAVSVVIPTLNEVDRLEPCLQGLSKQSYELREAIIVDSNSQDGTPALVKSYAERDRRIRLISDPPLPAGWVGRPWALHNGFLASDPASRWVLGIDADTQPQWGMIAGLLQAAAAEKFDLVSLSPKFILASPGEWWLQPALLMTLIYRFGAAGDRYNEADRVMANGQCFLCRRSVLAAVDGYTAAAGSFCDDVTLARKIAAAGYQVGFWDGSQVLKVRMYVGMAETWREWGRSLDLKDASSPAQIRGDLWLLGATQGLPLILLLLAVGSYFTGNHSFWLLGLLGLNLGLVMIRFALLLAIFPTYETAAGGWLPWAFFLSPLADPAAWYRIWLSAQSAPKEWRGRNYSG